jgi:hypothetical protein
MADERLLARLAQLGLPLLETEDEIDVNRTLAEVVKSRDGRLWEGFPVVLLNTARDGRFDPDGVGAHLATEEEQGDFRGLLVMALTVYDASRLSFPWAKRLKTALADSEKALLKSLRDALSREEPFDLRGMTLHPARLKAVFELYYQQEAEKGRQKTARLEELSVEYALSQVFSSKQKELFQKKLDGLPLTKTEREYYSRTVKKKVVALANVELHRLARNLLES